MNQVNCFQDVDASLEKAVEFREFVRKKNKIFVLTNGCFDLLHAGHVFSLTEACKQGDYLWVALNSDKSIRKLKGEKRPIIPQNYRAFLLRSLSVVSGVTFFDTSRLNSEILALKPDVYVKAGDYNESNIAKEELSALKCIGAKIKFVPFLTGHSTTSLVERIIKQNQ